MDIDLLIIGAGAAGLTAAYQAAVLQPELNILVLEKEKLPGRKLSAAGNGKCNVANRTWNAGCYYSENRSAIEEWISRHAGEEVITFLEELGILLYDKNGYVYPVSNQGRQVTNLLHEKGIQLGVTYLFRTRAKEIRPVIAQGEKGYQVTAVKDSGETVSFQAEYVLLAAGGMAAPKLGGCGDGYAMAKQLGLSCTGIYPVLSPIYVKEGGLSAARGVRIDGVVTLALPGQTVVKEAGQIQFNDGNLSGIVIMNLSCMVNASLKTADMTDSLRIDALPEASWEELKAFVLAQRQRFPGETAELMLSGIFPAAFVHYLLNRISVAGNLPLDSLTEKQINKLVSAVKKLTFTPVIREDYDKAQVTGGGIRLEEINPSAFESKTHPKLYLTGEVLDIHGKCGGYNLTFAMLSAITAVRDMLKKRIRDIK
ncbi:MAG: aminoacetone oxidase family FAD-binding enzyme [Bacteroidales bacterium]|nr:aminoacetone oxidase family FAD-binding enzyme [Clostridium sp.]MCM1204663.1 aminoacetone oxidase family FAD-binding enzyme [Bacteroidales bacterium]